jgi:hypothetical protein
LSLLDVPSRGEVRRAVKKLNLGGPGYTGNNAAAWKALLVNESVFAWIYEHTFRFFTHGQPPADWERQLLKILEKKGDLSLPKNYRGIMMLEVAYKVVANIMQSRLSKISETLPHECQCGFRAGRGGSDGKFNFFQALKKRREHGEETWALLLDLVKAFDRVPRELLWAVMLKLGVPADLVDLLIALHKVVDVHFEVDGVTHVLESIIGVKQGDILGPVLFNFIICAVMMVWKQVRDQEGRCGFRTKDDAVLVGRNWKEGGGVQLEADEGLYADDTQVMWGTRAWLTREAPILFGIFADFGLEVHVKKAGDTVASKSVVLFYPKPARCYTDTATFDSVDLSDIDIGNGESVAVVQEAKYLGSYATRAGTDLRRDVDVEDSQAIVRCAQAQALRSVYCGLVIAILLYGAEHWCLTAKMRRVLRAFHHRCMRSMCRLSLWHTRHNHVKTSTLATRLDIQTIETYIARRQMRWLGHVWRMPEKRLPKQLLTAWLPHSVPPLTSVAGLMLARADAITGSTFVIVRSRSPLWGTGRHPRNCSGSQDYRSRIYRGARARPPGPV